MKRLRKFADFSILPVIVWLTLQIFLSTQATQASPALAGVSGDGKNAATEYVEVVICTQYGFKTIKITADGAVPEEKKKPVQIAVYANHFVRLLSIYFVLQMLVP